jgi:protocatechuate 3,4-dioxygenase alpha subunit
MSGSTKLIPSGSQTVGPYFTIGLRDLVEEQVAAGAATESIEVRGSVVDRDGSAVPDAMLEFWGADGSGVVMGAEPGANGLPPGFCRAITDGDGKFVAVMRKTGPVALSGGHFQAPHMLVLVFARGLMRHLITRVYFADEEANAADPVLLEVPAARRHTLVARRDEGDARVFHWNVVLQGRDETAFFAW